MPVASAFNTKQGEADYNANGDWNKDGIIDMADLVAVAGNFGQGNCGGESTQPITYNIALKEKQLLVGTLYIEGDTADFLVRPDIETLIISEGPGDDVREIKLQKLSPNNYYGVLKADEEWEFSIDIVNKIIIAKVKSTPTQPTQQTPIINLISCQNRCGDYDENAQCQCDALKYNDYCADIKQYCPEIWNKNK